MSIFEIIVLIQLWMTALVGSCDIEIARDNYYSCLSKWKLIRKHHQIGHAGFMRKPEYMDEICILPDGVSVEAMSDCITNNVSALCNSITPTWAGLKNFVNFLCKRRETFVANRCRQNPNFQHAYTLCMIEGSREVSSREEDCRSFRKKTVCLHQALKTHCTPEDRPLFEKAFKYRDSPQTTYACTDLPTTVDETHVKQIDDKQTGGSVTLDKLTSNTANEQTTVDKSYMRTIDEKQTEKVVLVMMAELPPNTAYSWRFNTCVWLSSIAVLFANFHRH